jgi:integrase/recombinase XerC
MFPSTSSPPPAPFALPLPPAPSSAPPAPPIFGRAPLPSSSDSRPENDELVRQLGSRFEAFVDYALHVLNQSPATVRWYRDAMRNYARFLRLGLALPREQFQLRIYDIDGWVRWNIHDRKLAPISMNNYWRAIKRFWSDVASRDGVQHPFAGKKSPAKPQRVPKAHTPDECRRILTATENYPWETAFHRTRALAILGTALLAGLRKSELLSLEVRDVDLTAGTIRVQHGKGRGGGKERVAYMPDELRRLLSAYNAARAAAQLVCPDYFASLKYRRGIRQDTLKRIVTYVRAASGVKFTMHTLRHSYVSWLVRSGVPLPVASELAGHTMIETTMNYIRVFDTDKRAAVGRLRMQ